MSLLGTTYVILKNLEKSLSFEFCAEQPCLARVTGAVVLVHVDDLLLAGSRNYFHEVFLKSVVNFSELAEKRLSITFLKKRLIWGG